MPKKADDATPKVTKAKKSTLPAIKWTANTDKFLLSTVIDLLTFGEIDGAVWQLAAERMGGEGSGYTADKISQHYNKTLKGGELVTGDMGIDDYLIGEKLINKKFDLGLIDSPTRTVALRRLTKKGSTGSYLRTALQKGKELLDLNEVIAVANEEAEARKALQSGNVLKPTKKKAAAKADGEAEQKRAASAGEGEEDTLESGKALQPEKKGANEADGKGGKKRAASTVEDDEKTFEGEPSSKKPRQEATSLYEDDEDVLQDLGFE